MWLFHNRALLDNSIDRLQATGDLCQTLLKSRPMRGQDFSYVGFSWVSQQALDVSYWHVD